MNSRVERLRIARRGLEARNDVVTDVVTEGRGVLFIMCAGLWSVITTRFGPHPLVTMTDIVCYGIYTHHSARRR
jgi:hypothetical protein